MANANARAGRSENVMLALYMRFLVRACYEPYTHTADPSPETARARTPHPRPARTPPGRAARRGERARAAGPGRPAGGRAGAGRGPGGTARRDDRNVTRAYAALHTRINSNAMCSCRCTQHPHPPDGAHRGVDSHEPTATRRSGVEHQPRPCEMRLHAKDSIAEGRAAGQPRTARPRRHVQPLAPVRRVIHYRLYPVNPDHYPLHWTKTRLNEGKPATRIPDGATWARCSAQAYCSSEVAHRFTSMTLTSLYPPPGECCCSNVSCPSSKLCSAHASENLRSVSS